MAERPVAEVPAGVRRAALFPFLDLPDPPAGHPLEVVRRDGYALASFAGVAFGSAIVERVDLGLLDEVIADARTFMRERGKTRLAWSVAEAAEPAGLADLLRERGMGPYEEPPGEPQLASMAIVVPPAAGAPEIEARLARSFEEFQAATEIGNDSFGLSEHDSAAALEAAWAQWQLQDSAQPVERTFVAVVDGEIVGTAAMIFGRHAGFLAGGSTRPDMRGRGVYRALVRARWESAAEQGTPALTVKAGRMSRPILERLGFQTLGWDDMLLDRLDQEPQQA